MQHWQNKNIMESFTRCFTKGEAFFLLNADNYDKLMMYLKNHSVQIIRRIAKISKLVLIKVKRSDGYCLYNS